MPVVGDFEIISEVPPQVKQACRRVQACCALKKHLLWFIAGSHDVDNDVLARGASAEKSLRIEFAQDTLHRGKSPRYLGLVFALRQAPVIANRSEEPINLREVLVAEEV